MLWATPLVDLAVSPDGFGRGGAEEAQLTPTVPGMYEAHEIFNEPDPDTSVWRYLDFTKFVAMLQTQSLWFAKPETLGDPWEMAYTHANLARFRARFDSATVEDRLWAEMNYKATLQSMFVNCWHAGAIESAAMWRLYLKTLEGVAIQTTWSDLTASIGQTRDPVFGGLVRYIDFETDDTDDRTNMFFPTTTKRLSFGYENEARLVYWWRPDRTNGKQDFEQIPRDPGISVPVDMSRAIQRVILGPGSPPWFKDLVRRVAERYEFAQSIEDSTMDDDPTHFELTTLSPEESRTIMEELFPNS
jgi:hypothetical protein